MVLILTSLTAEVVVEDTEVQTYVAINSETSVDYIEIRDNNNYIF